MFRFRIAAAAMIAATLWGCDQGTPPAPQARPVRAITIERGAQGETVSLTGQIRAKDQTNLAFRLDGRMIERPVNVGDMVTAGQVVARLDPQIQQNALRSAQANLASVQALRTQAQLTFGRQQKLLKSGWTTRADFDSAQQSLLTVQAQVELRPGAGAHSAGADGLYGLVGRCRGCGYRSRRRAGRGGPCGADGCAARPSGRSRRRLRRAGAADADGPARPAGRDHPHRRPAGEGDRPCARGRTPGRSHDEDVPGQGRHHRSAGGHAPGIHGHRPHQAVRASRCGGPSERADRGRRAPCRVGGRSEEPDCGPAERRCAAL